MKHETEKIRGTTQIATLSPLFLPSGAVTEKLQGWNSVRGLCGFSPSPLSKNRFFPTYWGLFNAFLFNYPYIIIINLWFQPPKSQFLEQFIYPTCRGRWPHRPSKTPCWAGRCGHRPLRGWKINTSINWDLLGGSRPSPTVLIFNFPFSIFN